jgi:hypothetical protein
MKPWHASGFCVFGGSVKNVLLPLRNNADFDLQETGNEGALQAIPYFSYPKADQVKKNIEDEGGL